MCNRGWHLLFQINTTTIIPQADTACIHSLKPAGNLGVIWTPKPSKITLQETQILERVVLKNVIFKHIIEFISSQYKCHDIIKGYYALLFFILISKYMLKVAIYIHFGFRICQFWAPLVPISWLRS